MNTVEKEILDTVSLEEPWALIESFATFKREHPDDVNRGVDEVVSRLRRHGVEVSVHNPDLYQSVPKHARVEANGKTYPAKAAAYSADVRAGLTGQPVYVKNVEMGQEPASSFRGKVVISDGFAASSLISAFEEMGAVGVICVNPGVDIHSGSCSTIWGTPGLEDLQRKPKIPAIAVNKQDGDELAAIADRGDSVTIFTEMEEGWFASKLPEVFIKGAEEPDKYVLLHGHLDSWDVGVGDNATGDATMLEIARVLWLHRDKLRRSVRICWWPGHSQGRYAGSTWFADTFALDLEENAVAQVNCDSPGCRWATEYTNLPRMSETEEFLAGVVLEIAGKRIEGERPGRDSDYSFNSVGISSMSASSMMPGSLRHARGYSVDGCGGNIEWHTEHDTIEIADKSNLLRDLNIYLLAVVRNANAEILPLDWRCTAREFAATIADYQAKAGDRFDLTPSQDAIAKLAARLDSFYVHVENKIIEPKIANRVIQDLARILIPINFTRVERFRHDPARTIPPLPSIASAAELDRYGSTTLGFAQAQLMRGQNRLISALRQACQHIDLLVH